MEIISNYQCEIKCHLDKANLLRDALCQKSWVKDAVGYSEMDSFLNGMGRLLLES